VVSRICFVCSGIGFSDGLTFGDHDAEVCDMANLVRRVWDHVWLWIDWHGRITTVVLILISLGGTVLVNRALVIWSQVSGVYLWVISLLAFAIFLSTLALAGSKLHPRPDPTPETSTHTAAADQLIPAVNVQLTPSEGPSDRMLLAVKNLGTKQQFSAQCRLLTRRNDRNKMRLITFDLGWDNRDGREVSLAMGESCNLLIATAKKEQDMERVDLWEFSKLESAEWSRWHHGDKLPEYDLEVTVFGDQCTTPYAEQFTLRAGKAALEMFKITEPVAVSTGSEFAIVVEHCLVQECTYDHLAEMMNDSIIRVGSTHLVALVDFITTEWRIVNLRAKITYCDSKARPCQSVDIAPWKDFIGLDAEMEVGQGAKLVVALSDQDGNVFCPQRVQEAGGYLKLFQQVELKKGRGYASIRLNYEIQGIKATQSFFFSMFLGKGLKIERIAAMPHAA